MTLAVRIDCWHPGTWDLTILYSDLLFYLDLLLSYICYWLLHTFWQIPPLMAFSTISNIFASASKPIKPFCFLQTCLPRQSRCWKEINWLWSFRICLQATEYHSLHKGCDIVDFVIKSLQGLFPASILKPCFNVVDQH